MELCTANQCQWRRYSGRLRMPDGWVASATHCHSPPALFTAHLGHPPRLLCAQPLQVPACQRDHPPALVAQQRIQTMPPRDACGACRSAAAAAAAAAVGGEVAAAARRMLLATAASCHVCLDFVSSSRQLVGQGGRTSDERHSLYAGPSLGRHDLRSPAATDEQG